jgi:hypothetical protein
MVNPALAMLVVVGLFAWMLFRPQSTAPARIFLLIVAVMIFGPVSIWVMNADAAAFPWKFDYHLYLIDKSLGVSAFSIARHFSASHRAVLFVVYETLGHCMILWYALNLKLRAGRPKQLLISYAVSYGLAPLFYLAVPACGPRHAFGTLFPLGNPDVAAVTSRIDFWPNAIPSLHLASAILLLHYAGGSRFLRFLGWIFLAGTAAATLAFEHYLIDLVVAVPYAWFAISAAERKLVPAAWNLAGVLAWLVAIRFATPLLIRYPLGLQLAALATILAAALTLRISRPAGAVEPAPDLAAREAAVSLAGSR